jgi:Aerotolerance regulator N-terminal
MGFLSPWFLAGIAAVGLPLWIHLLRQYKRTPQPFSSLMFFERRVQSSVKHRRLRYLILLALRMALLILIALAFANPFVNRTSRVTSRRKLTVIAVDRSFSMRYGNRIEQARSEAHRLLNGLGGRQMAQIIALDSSIENLTQPELGRGILTAAIDSIQADDRASSFGELARALRMMDQSTGMQLDVHFISDLQQTSMPSGFRDLQLGPHTALQLHKIGGSKGVNWAVETVITPAHVYDATHTRVTATVAGWQTQPVSRTVSLLLDAKVIASKDVAIPANGRAQIEFLAVEVPYGSHKGQIRIEPHDGLPNDDSFPFSVERSDPRRVLFLYTRGRAREAFYYKAAMESAAGTGLIVQPAPAEQAENNDFSKYAFVVLNDAGDLGQKLAQALCSYISRGGAALIAIGPNTLREGRIPLSSNRVSQVHVTQGAGFVDSQHAAVAGAGRFENVQFSGTARWTPKANARVIAKLADGSPLLVEQAMGEGRVLIFASTLDNSTNDFPLHASFLPFVVQTGHYLAGAEDTASSVTAGTPVTLRRTRDQGTAADVIGPDGRHELSLSDATKALSFDVAQHGFYEVQRADGRRLLMAVHADRRESDLTAVPEETLALWRNTGITAQDGQSGTIEQQTRPQSFWRYALVLVLVAASMESVFANQYLKQKRQAA